MIVAAGLEELQNRRWEMWGRNAVKQGQSDPQKPYLAARRQTFGFDLRQIDDRAEFRCLPGIGRVQYAYAARLDGALDGVRRLDWVA